MHAQTKKYVYNQFQELRTLVKLVKGFNNCIEISKTLKLGETCWVAAELDFVDE